MFLNLSLNVCQELTSSYFLCGNLSQTLFLVLKRMSTPQSYLFIDENVRSKRVKMDRSRRDIFIQYRVLKVYLGMVFHQRLSYL